MGCEGRFRHGEGRERLRRVTPRWRESRPEGKAGRDHCEEGQGHGRWAAGCCGNRVKIKLSLETILAGLFGGKGRAGVSLGRW